jgi:hypothetical protein
MIDPMLLPWIYENYDPVYCAGRVLHEDKFFEQCKKPPEEEIIGHKFCKFHAKRISKHLLGANHE